MSTLKGALKHAEQFKTKYGNYSGPGSLPEVTAGVTEFVNYIIRRYHISSIIDAPCGDWGWFKNVNLMGTMYCGIDIVDYIIKENHQKYGCRNIQFYQADIIQRGIPRHSDLIICRDFLFHLADTDIKKVLRHFKKTTAKFLMATSFDYVDSNPVFQPFNFCDEYGFRILNMERPPFNFPEPIERLRETEQYQCKGRMVGLWEMEKINV